MSVDPRIQRLGDVKRGEAITARDENLVRSGLRKALSISGPNVVHTADGIFIRSPANQHDRFFAITGTPASAGSNQWRYPFDEVHKKSDGYGGWSIITNGRSDTVFGNAYNLAEVNNPTTTGILRNGVDLDNLVGTFALQAIPADSIVEIMLIPVTTTTAVEAWIINRITSVDGTCP
ncbi:MAG: hypothetical protein AAF432_00460 [Planctomycetota bacterium]